MKIRPMPIKHGIGFVTEDEFPADKSVGYRYEKVGRYHNYHVTKERLDWPLKYPSKVAHYVIDGFSPNLNKELHVGHLRNLAVAKSLERLLSDSQSRLFSSAKFVALLGASLGVKKKALNNLEKWWEFVEYEPEKYYDVLLPCDADIPIRQATDEEAWKDHEEASSDIINQTIHNKGGYKLRRPWVWDGPNGAVVVKRGDESPLYAWHDLVFAQEVEPTHYITGHEQREHFDNLGLGDKHLPMGLVLGKDGKKLKSRDGDALLADDALQMIMDNLEETPEPEKLAWNVLAWNFLHANRTKNVKFEAEKWTNPKSPGMHITYMLARLCSVLTLETDLDNGFWDYDPTKWREWSDLDVRLVGLAEQYPYYRHLAINQMDVSPIANFLQNLSQEASSAYHKEKIKGGRTELYYAMHHVGFVLENAMTDLGMFVLDEV